MDILGLIPSFGNLLFTVIAFIVALSVIVSVHEYGHYIVGRWSGIKAEVFSLGFGPVLWSRHDKRGTKWQIAALPFGGYVKFLGDANAASAKSGEAMEGLSAEERRHTMHGAPLWARAATVAAGPVFNFILSIAVFAGMALATGVAVDPPQIKALHDSPVAGIELQPGDTLLGVEGQAFPEEDLSDFIDALPVQPLLSYTVLRDGSEITALGPVMSPTRVAGAEPGRPAAEAGLQVGDVILSLNGLPVTVFNDMIDIVNGSDGAPVEVEYWRDGQIAKLTVQPERRDIPVGDNAFETRWLMGVNGGGFYEPVTETPGVGTALGLGVSQTWGLIEMTFSGLYHMIAGKISSCGISGPVGIAKISGTAASQGVASFIWFIALLSTAIGLLNLFPIPMLDGGHLVFHAWEAVTGNPPSDKALNILMTIGLTIVLSLLAFGLLNDLVLCR